MNKTFSFSILLYKDFDPICICKQFFLPVEKTQITNVNKLLNLFQIDTTRFPYPEKCIIYLLFSCFSVSVVLLIGFASGNNTTLA